jgi:hypothetical protein
MAYSLSQLETIWKQAAAGTKYATSAWATLMAAIALAESSGNADAVNNADNGGTQSSYGLWQISTGTHSPPAANWNDPVENAHLAIGKLNSQGLGAWGTYTSGAYRQYLGGASAASLPQTAGSPTGTVQAETAGLDILNPLSVAGSLTSAAKSLGDIVSFFNTLLNDIEWLFVPSHWVRIIAFLFGSGAVIAGTVALMRTGSGKQGDIVLAMGIGLVSFGGVMLFIAFHNLPTDVKNLGGLLEWVSKGVQGGASTVQNIQAGV